MSFYFMTRIAIIIFLLEYQFCDIDGFITNKCNHEQLTSALREMDKCYINVVNFYIHKLSSIPSGGKDKKNSLFKDARSCNLPKKAKRRQSVCVQRFIRTCFGEEILKLFSEDLIKFKEKSEKCKTPSLKVSGREKNRKTFTSTETSQISQIQKNKNYLVSNIHFDKKCDGNQRLKSIAINFSCARKNSQTLMSSIALFQHTNPRSLPFCNTVSKVFQRCFKPTSCFSEQEMNFIREFISIHIRMAMEVLLNTYKNMGSLENLKHLSYFMTNMSYNLTSYHSSYPVKAHQRMSTWRSRKEKGASEKMYENIIGLILQDYDTGDCRHTLQQTSVSSTSSSLLNTTWITFIVCHINMLFIINRISRCS